MQYLQYMSFTSQGNSLNYDIKVYRFCHFLKFRFKTSLEKLNISKKEKSSDNFRYIFGILKALPFSTNPVVFPYFKASCRKIHLKVSRFSQNPSLTCDVITTSLKSHVPHLIHLITFFEAIPIDCYLDQVSIYGC